MKIKWPLTILTLPVYFIICLFVLGIMIVFGMNYYIMNTKATFSWYDPFGGLGGKLDDDYGE